MSVITNSVLHEKSKNELIEIIARFEAEIKELKKEIEYLEERIRHSEE